VVGRLTALEEALGFLFARTTGGYKFGLDRTEALLDALGNPHRACPVIHVAGTNGKGSSLATAEALLLGRGLRVGKYTSPHLVDFRERVLVNGEAIEGAAILEFVARWTPLVEKLGATFFEATTALAFDAFARAKVDVALIETGLGGRLDSTNVVDPVVAGVTTIGWDHTEYLGHSLDAIALEKAGIFKPDRPAVIGESSPELRDTLRRRALEIGAIPIVVNDMISVGDVGVGANGTHVALTMGRESCTLRTPLTGRHQAFNLAFTLALLHAAPQYRFTLAEADPLLSGVSLPGRFQRAGRYVFDVAHNADGARTLAETLRALHLPRPLKAVFCALRDKEWGEMLLALAPVVDGFVLTNAPTAPPSRAWSLEDGGEFLRRAKAPGVLAHTLDEALAAVEDAATVVVTGSFHTVGDMMVRLHLSPLAL